jgi:hypothetical protein
MVSPGSRAIKAVRDAKSTCELLVGSFMMMLVRSQPACAISVRV